MSSLLLPSIPLVHLLAGNSSQRFSYPALTSHGHPLVFFTGSPLDYRSSQAGTPQVSISMRRASIRDDSICAGTLDRVHNRSGDLGHHIRIPWRLQCAAGSHGCIERPQGIRLLYTVSKHINIHNMCHHSYTPTNVSS